MATIVCPTCKGAKTMKVFADGTHPDGTRWGDLRTINCFTCKGDGSITGEHQERLERGRKLKEARLANGLTLFEASRLQGVSVGVISARERGDNA